MTRVLAQAVARRRLNRSLAAAALGGLAAPMINGRASAQAVKLVFSHHIPTTHIFHVTAENLARYVAEGTKGQITIDIRPASQLFNLRTSAEAIQLGTLDMCWSDLGTLANWQPQFGFTSLPFLFTGYDHAKKVLYGPVGAQVSAEAKATLGVEVLSLGASGFRIFCGRKEIRNAGDCRGIKLRVPEIPVYIEMARALATNPTPIPAGEIYTALQTGVVDAIEVPADFITTQKVYEVSKNATRTHHIFTEVSMFSSAKRMASLSADQQKVIRDAAKRAVQVEMWEQNLKEQVAAWNDLATRVKAIPDPDVPSFREKMKPVLENFVKRAPKAQAFIEGAQKAG
jgi:tripartite ATP-independent transporter DctP family solute receptor